MKKKILVKSRFRNDNGQRYVKQLFQETACTLPVEERTFEPLYSLHEDKEGLINFRKEYLSDMDPTGYKTSQRLLENYDHWLLLMKSAWFRAAKEVWDTELHAKLAAEGLQAIREISRATEEDGVKAAQRLTAAKILLDYGKNQKPKRQAGRPTTEEVKGELKQAAKDMSDLEADAARILEFKKSG